MRNWSAIAITVVLISGCTSTTNAVPLPTDPSWRGGGCRGTGTMAVVHGAATDPRVTWVTSPDGTVRTEITWPVGYSARFDPGLEVVDQRGKVVAREGDHLTGWCQTVDTPAGQPIWVEAGHDLVPAPSLTYPNLGISNGTTITVTLFVNGVIVDRVNPGGIEDPVFPALPSLPWRVEAHSPSGRVLASLKISASVHVDSGTGVYARVALSCGELDLWSGPIPTWSGPVPTGGDCT